MSIKPEIKITIILAALRNLLSDVEDFSKGGQDIISTIQKDLTEDVIKDIIKEYEA